MSEWSAAEYTGRPLPGAENGRSTGRIVHREIALSAAVIHSWSPREREVAPPILRVFSQPNTEGAPMTLPPDVVRRPCVCGISLSASRTAPFAAVTRHNATPEHGRWWERVRAIWQGEEAS